MKKTRFKFLVVSTFSVLGVLVAACASHPISSRYAARFPASVTSDPYSVESVEDGTPKQLDDEKMRPEQLAEKKAVCGDKSTEVDSLSNFPRTPTPFFEGYARVLSDPHEAVLAKVALMRAAQKSIDVSTYIFTPDQSSNAYVYELRHAIRRGVNVRLLIDAGGSAALAVKDYYNHVRSLLYLRKQELKAGNKPGNVDVVIFHPIFKVNTLWSSFKDRFLSKEDLDNQTIANFDRRSHDKILIIDKEIKSHTYAIVGGRNIDNSYYGVPQIDQETYNDMELLVRDNPSPAAHTLANTLGHHFDDLFCSKGNRWLSTSRFGTEAEKALLGIESIKDVGPEIDGTAPDSPKNAMEILLATSDLQQRYDEMLGSNSDPIAYFAKDLTPAKLHPANEEENIIRSFDQVFTDPSGNSFLEKNNNGDSIYGNFLALTAQAEKSIDLLTPYIFLPPHERDCLKAWVMVPGTNRHVRLLSNSVATSDSALAMQTFDNKGGTADSMLKEGPQDGVYSCPEITGAQDKDLPPQYFVNKDSEGNRKIEVYELGRPDSVLFKGDPIPGYTPNQFYGKLHAKFAILDGRSSWVGSDNLDERSRHLNSETAIFVDSDKIGEDLTKQFNIFVSKSVRYGSPELELMRNHPAVKRRVQTMSVIHDISDAFPKLGFGD